MGKFVIRQTNGSYQFTLHAKNGHLLLTSKQYDSKQICEESIFATKINVQDKRCFTRITESAREFYFILMDEQGDIFCASGKYSDCNSRDVGIASVRNNAFIARIEDRSFSVAEEKNRSA